MYYQVYTKSAIVKFPVIFKCEHCGKYNVAINPFLIQSSYSDKGAFTQKAIDKREQTADTELLVKQQNLFNKITDETAKRKVKNTGYVCTCSKCHTVPKWSNFRNKKLDKACNIAIVISILISAFLTLGILENDYSVLPYFLIPIGLIFATCIPRAIIYSRKSTKVKNLNKEYMPIVCKNEEQLNNALKDLNI